jgi:hypothetical protein
MKTTRPGGPNRERSFGMSVGAVLCVLAVAIAWRGRVTRAEALGGVVPCCSCSAGSSRRC